MVFIVFYTGLMIFSLILPKLLVETIDKDRFKAKRLVIIQALKKLDAQSNRKNKLYIQLSVDIEHFLGNLLFKLTLKIFKVLI